MALAAQLVRIEELSLSDRSEMLTLMDSHFDGVSPEEFHADLNEKHWVIKITARGKLCGFSTQMILTATSEGRPVKALFSGDTIIDREHWGDHSLMRVGGSLALSLAEQEPDQKWYWFLISQGYKTYRFLPLFFHEFYPRFDVPTPVNKQATIDAFAAAKFRDRYDPASGVIRSSGSQYRLRQGVADLTAERLRDPHIGYFAQQNPGHIRGDELCCIAPLFRKNFTRAAIRLLGERDQIDA